MDHNVVNQSVSQAFNFNAHVWPLPLLFSLLNAA